jgi:hypothetical protein
MQAELRLGHPSIPFHQPSIHPIQEERVDLRTNHEARAEGDEVQPLRERRLLIDGGVDERDGVGCQIEDTEAT